MDTGKIPLTYIWILIETNPFYILKICMKLYTWSYA